ncbi:MULTISPECIES: type VII secretion-associated serine protease mycosin [unclassified Streptomyces]|uniref:type VII secretion-associated serine protease mycosin n=1 Tax=unclassified Streptomyces TaxID=2593676 RepID=UPI002E2E5C0E|nr:type VII secretion-associated serine protease mycosin [Streptomyces sp. NBC_01423]WSX91581.1 type VII secretion-associated serine protease mycosin [Streptomyces sp. NBC_00891]WSY06059.1 type VII secretion-associated serine protease mycosin [Streptomyces sp. NBC_00890]WSZ07683.1 type VII secretion-associated serine protease mycosin [Streptomyces sp. NBC_00869]WSZ24818.1 type VII secretion-associated serine protease mycosin [Streptomyces sp. NBC_00870]
MPKQIQGRPWSLQRLVFDQLWQDTKGKGVRVAVIDTGVDATNPQLKGAVDRSSGTDLLPALNPDGTKAKGKAKGKRGDGTTDVVGHGTKVAGIIAARPRSGTGFVGLAPEATIIPIRQNDDKGNGTAATMAEAIRHAIRKHARVINISQDTAKPLRADSELGRAVGEALKNDIVVVASAGNDGLTAQVKATYPAAYPGVLAVAASDRNDERAPFSQTGDFVGVAAPGVDMVSTVPKGGQCVDNGTSFSAPYVAGVAALIRAKHPRWTQAQVVAQIEQTAERAVNGRDDFIGWGVVDPVRALNDDEHPVKAPTPDRAVSDGPVGPEPVALQLRETRQERMTRISTYVLAATGLLVAVVAGVAVLVRDRSRP